ncbi:hypothetical protein TREPR_2809 [Treponema primitia ZAS-2]|uniref:Uncharacterized protein n=1 Tax=Treponema primitia (strain ATCC BAA-887 / DSM 12427 / ZAS-2) TaxID=545694 RepID=F5YPY1_TREPZ|nr:hypothetical protein [Treponema primitia]AEF83545.1 hypothetical protein TREPR_2809 [Treponema primitia ZAS-2]
MYKPQLLFLLFLAPTLHGLDVRITGKEAGVDVKNEYNRTYNQCWTFSGFGALTLNDRYTLKTGLALWETTVAWETDAFVSASAALPLPIPFPVYADFAYMLNAMPDYETSSHTLLPALGVRGKYAGFALGLRARFSVFYDDPPIFEPILAFSGYVNFFNSEPFRLGLGCANYDDFIAGNFGSYYFNLNSKIRLLKFLFLVNGLDLYQTGSVGLAANLYGLAFNMGVVFNW